MTLVFLQDKVNPKQTNLRFGGNSFGNTLGIGVNMGVANDNFVENSSLVGEAKVSTPKKDPKVLGAALCVVHGAGHGTPEINMFDGTELGHLDSGVMNGAIKQFLNHYKLSYILNPKEPSKLFYQKAMQNRYDPRRF
ncbi:MAG: hypothetical protein U0V72_04620 [Cytophagales bacterium]